MLKLALIPILLAFAGCTLTSSAGSSIDGGETYETIDACMVAECSAEIDACNRSVECDAFDACYEGQAGAFRGDPGTCVDEHPQGATPYVDMVTCACNRCGDLLPVGYCDSPYGVLRP